MSNTDDISSGTGTQNGTDTDIIEYDGVDMVIVIDNSGSMAEEQEILATGFFTMINALVNPVAAQDVAAKADDIRVAVVTSDLGLQYSGKPGPVTGTSSGVTGCSAMGDDGAFQTYATGLTVDIQDNEIDCVPGGNQCPNAQWTCQGGKCRAPGSGATAQCPSLAGTYAELTPQNNNDNLAFQVACMAQQGTKGCGIEQQLEAAVVGLKKHPTFVRDNYLLAVLIVSDEEDCSIKDKGLFDTPEWKDKVNGLNTACNYPESNETNFLYTIERYKAEYLDIKAFDPNAVVFAAIVGVPHENTLCQGRGNEIGQACLDSSDMTLEKTEFTDPASGQKYWHFRSACVRDDDPGTPVIETEAKPGRRYVQLARAFGEKGYVYSICNKDWGPAMKEIAGLIASQLGGTCCSDPMD
jgi:hypothetical protein